jgi:hypothetical protein
MIRLLREPLLHFLFLGVVIFAVYNGLFRDLTGEAGKIVVTQGKINHLAATFASTRQRPPTEEELLGLIQDYIREEVFYREAMALGLDRDDTVIRRRLRQKMEFIAADMAAQAKPAEVGLQAYLAAHPTTFAVEPRFTFRHVYLDPQRRRSTLARDIDRTLAELRREGSKARLAARGDSLLLDQEFENAPAIEVKKAFGPEFFAHLSTLTPGEWHGPVSSGYGLHLVFVNQRIEGHVPPLAQVRDAVRREWTNAQRLEANEKFYQQLLKRYTVMIEEPQRFAEIPNSKSQNPNK